MSHLSWGYEDQCLKLTRYWCNVNMHFPWFVADNGTVYGGYDTNPDWRNGVPDDELCEWAIWQIAKEFTRSFLSNFDCNYTWREYSIDHRQNYLVYQKHPLIEAGTVFASSGKIDPWDDQPWLVQWDMNWDANGNSPLYFPFLGNSDPAINDLNPPLEHWFAEYSTGPETCVKHFGMGAGDPKTRGEMKCCGVYPHRYPYRDGSHECIGNQIVEIGSL